MSNLYNYLETKSKEEFNLITSYILLLLISRWEIKILVLIIFKDTTKDILRLIKNIYIYWSDKEDRLKEDNNLT